MNGFLFDFSLTGLKCIWFHYLHYTKRKKKKSSLLTNKICLTSLSLSLLLYFLYITEVSTEYLTVSYSLTYFKTSRRFIINFVN